METGPIPMLSLCLAQRLAAWQIRDVACVPCKAMEVGRRKSYVCTARPHQQLELAHAEQSVSEGVENL